MIVVTVTGSEVSEWRESGVEKKPRTDFTLRALLKKKLFFLSFESSAPAPFNQAFSTTTYLFASSSSQLLLLLFIFLSFFSASFLTENSFFCEFFKLMLCQEIFDGFNEISTPYHAHGNLTLYWTCAPALLVLANHLFLSRENKNQGGYSQRG